MFPLEDFEGFGVVWVNLASSYQPAVYIQGAVLYYLLARMKLDTNLIRIRPFTLVNIMILPVSKLPSTNKSYKLNITPSLMQETIHLRTSCVNS